MGPEALACRLPVGRQQVEGDGTADDLLHVGADDGQLHHEPQDDPRHLERAHTGDSGEMKQSEAEVFSRSEATHDTVQL